MWLHNSQILKDLDIVIYYTASLFSMYFGVTYSSHNLSLNIKWTAGVEGKNCRGGREEQQEKNYLSGLEI